MIVMNIPATKTTLTDSLGLRGLKGLKGSGQREVTNSSRRPAVLVVPAAACPGLVSVNSRHSCW